MIHIIDSAVYRNVWGTDEMREIFDEHKKIQGWLDILATLAEVQAEQGIIPKEAAEEIKKSCDLEKIDLERVRKGYEETGHSTLGLIRELKRICRGDAGEWVYYGATVQDITDTWLAIALLKAYQIIYRDLLQIEEILIDLAERHRDTVMIGRTHGQQGLPITFGFKVAVWAVELRRHIERLKSLKSRLGEGQLSGAVGTLSSYGENGLLVQQLFFSRLGLRAPLINWLTSRDTLVEFVNLLSLIGNTFDKLGHEIYNLQRPEIGEVSEGFQYGMVGSITMPHKRNPETGEHFGTLARLIRHHAQALSENMIHEHERDGRSWKAEWAIIPPVFMMIGAILQLAKRTFTNLQVNEERMKKNLYDMDGLLFSEKIMMILAQKTGKQTAHEEIYRLTMKAVESKRHLKDVILQDEFARKYFSQKELDDVMNYGKLTGHSTDFVDQSVKHIRNERKKDVL